MSKIDAVVVTNWEPDHEICNTHGEYVQDLLYSHFVLIRQMGLANEKEHYTIELLKNGLICYLPKGILEDENGNSYRFDTDEEALDWQSGGDERLTEYQINQAKENCDLCTDESFDEITGWCSEFRTYKYVNAEDYKKRFEQNQQARMK